MSNIKDDEVHLDHFGTVSTVPTGPAVVMFQSNGQNSIIVVGDGDGFVHASAQYSQLMHEITFSSNDEPKIMSRLT